MGETLVVNLFLWFRVFLVGGILILFPRITRKGLLFGVYVGEKFAQSEAAQKLLRAWDRGCVAVMVSALLVGLVGSVAGHAVAGNLIGTSVLLLGGVVLYFRWYAKVKALPRPDVTRQAERATAALQVGKPNGEAFAKITLVICFVVALATVVYAWVSYQAMPDRIPTPSKILGPADSWTDKSFVAVMYGPSWNLVLSSLFALLALIIATGKRSLREGPGGRSAEAQDAFRATNAKVFSGTALFVCALLTVYSVQCIRMALGETESLGPGIWCIMVSMIVFALASLILIFRHYGQGGALIEQSSAGGELTGGLADNAHWICGILYINREDPSMIIENRFGIGYTMNYGNWNSVLFSSVFAVLFLSLIALGIFCL
jgi:uncharacterized membrane protein